MKNVFELSVILLLNEQYLGFGYRKQDLIVDFMFRILNKYCRYDLHDIFLGNLCKLEGFKSHGHIFLFCSRIFVRIDLKTHS